MGQAKQRGDRNERRRQAIERAAQGLVVPKIDALREAHGIDAAAVFLGYVVRFPDDDTFVHTYNGRADAMHASMVKGPERAQVFATPDDAMRVAATFDRPADMAAMFETNDQLLVLALAGNAAATAVTVAT